MCHEAIGYGYMHVLILIMLNMLTMRIVIRVSLDPRSHTSVHRLFCIRVLQQNLSSRLDDISVILSAPVTGFKVGSLLAFI